MKKILIALALIFNFTLVNAEPKAADNELKIARVIETSPLNQQEELGYSEQLVKLKLKENGEEIFINNTVPDNIAYAIIAEKGRDYIIATSEEGVYITDYYREPVIKLMMLVFFFLIVVCGGFKGFKAIVALLLTGLAIIYILLPGIEAGQNPIFLSVIISAISTACTMLLVAGWNKKSLAATIGTTGGVGIAGCMGMMVIKHAPLSGLASTESQILLANSLDKHLNFPGILAAGIIIASLGAAMDVAVSIASAAQELHATNPNQPKRELLKHCMNIGKDIMGTMVDTLILAYVGASIPLFVLLYNESGLRLLNMEIIATELTSAIIGSIGILLSVPITAAVAVLLLKGFKSTSTQQAAD